MVKVEPRESRGEVVVHVERLGHRRLRCGVCGPEARRVAPTLRPERRWPDLAMRDSLSLPIMVPQENLWVR